MWKKALAEAFLYWTIMRSLPTYRYIQGLLEMCTQLKMEIEHEEMLSKLWQSLSKEQQCHQMHNNPKAVYLLI